jgi:hypothetical protein
VKEMPEIGKMKCHCRMKIIVVTLCEEPLNNTVCSPILFFIHCFPFSVISFSLFSSEFSIYCFEIESNIRSEAVSRWLRYTITNMTVWNI